MEVSPSVDLVQTNASIGVFSDLSLSQTLDIFKLLTQTYSRYVDAVSRDAVESVGTELVRRDELRGTPEGEPDESKLGVTEQILGWFTNEVGRISKRPGFVLFLHDYLYASCTYSLTARLRLPTCLFF